MAISPSFHLGEDRIVTGTGYVKYTNEDLVSAIKTADSKADVLRILGVSKSGAAYKRLDKEIENLNLDISHFYSKSYLRGVPTPLEAILVEKSSYTNSNRLRQRLIESGILKNECVACGITEWMNEPISLQLDHINGNNTDNRIENLRILCPNCHSQTETWGNKTRI